MINILFIRIWTSILDVLILFVFLSILSIIIPFAEVEIQLQIVILSSIFLIYFLKDSFFGISPAKLLFKLQVVDNKTGEPANPIKCVVRNLFITIWPIEFVFILIDPSRRLGDIITGTKIAKKSQFSVNKFSVRKFSISIVIAGTFIFLLSTPAYIFQSHMISNLTPYTMQEKGVKLSIDSLICSEKKSNVSVFISNNAEKFTHVGIFIAVANTKFIDDTTFYEKFDRLIVQKVNSVMDSIDYEGDISYICLTNKKVESREFSFNSE